MALIDHDGIGAPLGLVSGAAVRVLYVIDGLGPGGAERSLAAMSPHLVGGGIDLHIATLHDREGFLEEVLASGAVVHSLAGGTSRRHWLRGLITLLGTTRPDLVHTTLFDSDVLGRVAATFRRVPVVSSLVNVRYGDAQRREFGANQWRRAAVHGADVVTARFVRRFHAVSTAVADEMAPALHVSRERVDVIPRGRDRQRLGENTPERRAKARAALGIDDGRSVALCVARQDYAKGIDVLLPAWARVAPRVDGGILLVAGREGTRSAELREVAGSLGLDDSSLRFLGVRSDVPELLCAADVFVLPSRREGLPGALLEAMAMSVPIVATGIAATRDAVPSERFARLVALDDVDGLAAALLETFTDSDAARERATNARTRFDAEFTIEQVATRMCDFYARSVA
jgi:glycosyltransferase involved in cell wall biosynthesis